MRPALAAVAAGGLAIFAAGCAMPAAESIPGRPSAAAVAPAPAGPIALKNPGFELDPDPGRNCAPLWECSAHSNAQSFRHEIDSSRSAGGRRSLRVQRVADEPWGLVTQSVADPRLRGARLRFTLSVRTEGATGGGGGAFVLVQDGNGRTIGHQRKLARGSTGWTRQAIEFEVPAAAVLFEVGATLEGPGTLWIDEARLEVIELASGAKKPV